jgi:predicted RNase H-like nuclease (RuvC/YqgF family)
MKKAYFIVPIVGCIIFTFFYLQTLSDLEAREKAKKEAAIAAREEKRMNDIFEREKAYEEAVKLQARRKKEREEKEAREKAEKEQLLALRDDRDKAFRERDRQVKTSNRLGDEIKIEEEAITKLKSDVATQKGEIEFLKTYVTKAQQNQKTFEQVLSKIDAAEKAAAEAARAAEAAKKNS